MDYERLTPENTEVLLNTNYLEDQTLFFRYAIRLKELEDKIKSGELISTKENGATEIEFFVKHNKKVRLLLAEEVMELVKGINRKSEMANTHLYIGFTELCVDHARLERELKEFFKNNYNID